MASRAMVNELVAQNNLLGMVAGTTNLDHWDGHDWNAGAKGVHLGMGKTKDGRIYVCVTTDWDGEQDYAFIVDEEEASDICLRYDPDEYEGLFGKPAPTL